MQVLNVIWIGNWFGVRVSYRAAARFIQVICDVCMRCTKLGSPCYRDAVVECWQGRSDSFNNRIDCTPFLVWNLSSQNMLRILK